MWFCTLGETHRVVTLTTRLTDTLACSVPVVQAPVGSATTPDLAAAVADAGGLGTLAITWRDPADARRALAETLDRTDGAVAANVVVDDATGVAPVERQVAAALDAGVEILSFSFGDAAPHVDRVHDAGGLVLQTVGSAEAARDAVAAGVDAVVAQGWEAGGHVQSEVATMPLVPRVVDAVPDTPVIAAGGIADGRGIAAALTLGADGAWLGTRFLATPEANVHRAYRRRVLAADAADTAYGEVFDEGWPGMPHRVLATDTAAAAERGDGDSTRPTADDTDRPGAGEVVARDSDGDPIHRYEDALATEGVTGDVDALPLYAGQSAGLTDETLPAGDLVDRLVAETRDALAGSPGGAG